MINGAEAQSGCRDIRLSVCRCRRCHRCRKLAARSRQLLDWLSQFNKLGMAAFQTLGRFSGVPLLALAIGTASAARGLLRGRRWAWWFTVVLFTVNGFGDLVSFPVTRDALRSASGVVISSAFLYALSRHHVRLYFK